MKERNTQAQDQVFTREQALWHAAWLISRVREKVAELYGWAVAGEATSAFTPLILAQEVHAALQEALTFARAFADYQSLRAERTRLSGGGPPRGRPHPPGEGACPACRGRGGALLMRALALLLALLLLLSAPASALGPQDPGRVSPLSDEVKGLGPGTR